jgi:hypothetical protein
MLPDILVAAQLAKTLPAFYPSRIFPSVECYATKSV